MARSLIKHVMLLFVFTHMYLRSWQDHLGPPSLKRLGGSAVRAILRKMYQVASKLLQALLERSYFSYEFYDPIQWTHVTVLYTKDAGAGMRGLCWNQRTGALQGHLRESGF